MLLLYCLVLVNNVMSFHSLIFSVQYVCKRLIRELDINGQHVWVILYKITESSSFPPVDGVVRATDYFGSVAMRSDGQGGTDRLYSVCLSDCIL